MDTLISLVFCLVQNLITKFPLAAIVIAVVLLVYYKFSRLLLKNLFKDTFSKKTSDTKAGGPAEFSRGLNVFFAQASELLILLLILFTLCSAVGLMDFGGTVRLCMGEK